MKIVDAKVIVCSPGRNFVRTLKLVTEDEMYGLGDATLNGRELAVASYLNDHIVPLLIDRDARNIEDTGQYFYKGAYWRRGPVTMTAIAAVGTALWDIKAKALATPFWLMDMPVEAILNRLSMRFRNTSSSAIRRFAHSQEFRVSPAPTELVEAVFITSQRKRTRHPRTVGLLNSI